MLPGDAGLRSEMLMDGCLPVLLNSVSLPSGLEENFSGASIACQFVPAIIVIGYGGDGTGGCCRGDSDGGYRCD